MSAGFTWIAWDEKSNRLELEGSFTAGDLIKLAAWLNNPAHPVISNKCPVMKVELAKGTMKTSDKDGVWISDGLSADFRLLYEHPNVVGVYFVQTAAGDHYAYEHELTWNISNYENKTTSAALRFYHQKVN